MLYFGLVINSSSSATLVTVTVCGVSQLPLVPTVKVSDEGITVTTSTSELARLTVSSDDGTTAGTIV